MADEQFKFGPINYELIAALPDIHGNEFDKCREHWAMYAAAVLSDSNITSPSNVAKWADLLLAEELKRFNPDALEVCERDEKEKDET